ncbi:SDR family NAD(P)-dependent oxidoreductase [Mycobacterium conspicuum]|jgi:NAD(P)-dependent dehydrogenase (short-subunit alcohol dehydrogenase family)|uniref:Putative short-chain dehydrogenase/reductase n=1 Tax=Mycobacterium conspicuum TaxID=44010 RepID=A0A1X1TCF1_9MYCO|nr:SDR family NAD(P)-dependent oxidoreductase [Mycobacterium conspicuum]ORV42251.1 3-oxoacyl-ACP reductase [Mycobacterium conspicuum]BBZ39967.1 putative short-chain dehydrogenase/reductase [Mycobacterium conspicuum]
MSELRFDGRVAIVTGAGGQHPSLGRSHVTLLAERGAKVVVNDLGVGPDGRGILRANAEQVVDEIRAAGGEAVHDQHSVADEEGARSVVATALDAWGRLDILVNNAGVCAMAHFDEISSTDIRQILDVHLMGTLWMCRAAWPHLREATYGRIVNTTSGAMFGIEHLSIYGAAKSGIFGLTRGLAVEGATLGIKVNALGPAANTTAIHHFNEASPFTSLMEEHFPTSLVSPVVAYLAHESCALSGANLEAAAGNVGLRVFGQTAGYTDADLTVEKVRDNLSTITDKRTATMIPDPGEVPAGPTGAVQLGAVLKPYQPI